MESTQPERIDAFLPADFFNRMARAGALAPSGDNLQPWSFASDGCALLVRHDPNRDQSLFNVRHLASFIALGAVLENVLIAASAEGYFANIKYFPNGQSDHLIARITFAQGASKDPLADYLDKRCTNRRPYEKKAIPSETLSSLDGIKRFPAANLVWVHDPTKLGALGKIVAQADRLIFENQRIHDHLFSTLRWNRTEVEQTRDGLPIESLELGKIGSMAFRGLKRWSVVSFLNYLGFSRAAAGNSVGLMQRCAAAGMITAPDLSPASFMEAGRVFQRLWLQAMQANLALQPMTAIIFFQLRSRLADYSGLSGEQITVVDGLRRELERFFGLTEDRVPAMLFRLGYAAAPSARTIRRDSMLLA